MCVYIYILAKFFLFLFYYSLGYLWKLMLFIIIQVVPHYINLLFKRKNLNSLRFDMLTNDPCLFEWEKDE